MIKMSKTVCLSLKECQSVELNDEMELVREFGKSWMICLKKDGKYYGDISICKTTDNKISISIAFNQETKTTVTKPSWNGVIIVG